MPDATITGSLLDALGTAYDFRRTKGWVEFNTAEKWVVDADGAIRSDVGQVTVNEDGSFIAAGIPVPSASTNPTDFQIRLVFDVPPRLAGSRGKSKAVRFDFGWFTVTADALFKDLVEEQYVPPTYLSTVTAELDTYVDDAQAARTGAETARDEAEAARDTATEIALGDAEAAFDGFLASRGLPVSGSALTASFVLFRNNDGTPVAAPKVVAITLTPDGTDIDDIRVYDDITEVGS